MAEEGSTPEAARQDFEAVVTQLMMARWGTDNISRLAREVGIGRQTLYKSLQLERHLKPHEARKLFTVLTEAGAAGAADRARLRAAFLKTYLGDWEDAADTVMTPIETNTTGVVRTFRRGEWDSIVPLGRLITEAQEDIFFLGISLVKLENFSGVLDDKARGETGKSPVWVRLMVPDPCVEGLVEDIAHFLKREAHVPRELCSFLSYYETLYNEEKAPAHLAIRVYTYHPSFTITMFDRQRGFIETYMRGWRTSDRIMLELDLTRKAAHDVLTNLEAFWGEATRLRSADDFTQRIIAAKAIEQKLTSETGKDPNSPSAP